MYRLTISQHRPGPCHAYFQTLNEALEYRRTITQYLKVGTTIRITLANKPDVGVLCDVNGRFHMSEHQIALAIQTRETSNN